MHKNITRRMPSCWTFASQDTPKSSGLLYAENTWKKRLTGCLKRVFTWPRSKIHSWKWLILPIIPRSIFSVWGWEGCSESIYNYLEDAVTYRLTKKSFQLMLMLMEFLKKSPVLRKLSKLGNKRIYCKPSQTKVDCWLECIYLIYRALISCFASSSLSVS